MGTNFFSDLLTPISDLIESIPIVGPIIETADKVALNTDPSQLLTSAVGKMIGGDFEDQFTSEESRKGASHTVGLAALSYLLAGGEAAGLGGSSAEASASAEAAVVTDFAGEAAIYGGAGEAAATTEAGLLSQSAVAGSNVAEPSIIDNLLGNKKVIDAVIKAGKAGAKMVTPEKSPTQTGGASSTMAPQQPIQDKDINQLMKESLGPSSNNLFNNKAPGNENALYKSFLSGNQSTQLTTNTMGKDLTFKSRVTKPFSSKRNESSGLRNLSIASPFYQQEN